MGHHCRLGRPAPHKLANNQVLIALDVCTDSPATPASPLGATAPCPGKRMVGRCRQKAGMAGSRSSIGIHALAGASAPDDAALPCAQAQPRRQAWFAACLSKMNMVPWPWLWQPGALHLRAAQASVRLGLCHICLETTKPMLLPSPCAHVVDAAVQLGAARMQEISQTNHILLPMHFLGPTAQLYQVPRCFPPLHSCSLASAADTRLLGGRIWRTRCAPGWRSTAALQPPRGRPRPLRWTTMRAW